MNVLMVGAGAGSWEIRGRQLGNAIGARVTSSPTAADWRWADVAVLVKRSGAKFAPVAHAAGVPIVWDALDFWQQPDENRFTEGQAKALLIAHIAEIRPSVTLCATQAMADACRGVYLPHHSWRGLEPVKARDGALTVAYQGNPAYLGVWGGHLVRACAARRWKLVLNPTGPMLWAADILVSFRDGPWDGWMCREWKSGVKLVNAIAAGRPILTQPSAAARELGVAGSLVDVEADLDVALDTWADFSARSLAVEQCRAVAPTYRLPAVAERYRAILEGARASCAA